MRQCNEQWHRLSRSCGSLIRWEWSPSSNDNVPDAIWFKTRSHKCNSCHCCRTRVVVVESASLLSNPRRCRICIIVVESMLLVSNPCCLHSLMCSISTCNIVVRKNWKNNNKYEKTHHSSSQSSLIPNPTRIPVQKLKKISPHLLAGGGARVRVFEVGSKRWFWVQGVCGALRVFEVCLRRWKTSWK